MASPGSFAEVPRSLLQEIQHLEKLFTVETAKLKEITSHFVSELTKGQYTALLETYGLLLNKDMQV